MLNNCLSDDSMCGFGVRNVQTKKERGEVGALEDSKSLIILVLILIPLLGLDLEKNRISLNSSTNDNQLTHLI